MNAPKGMATLTLTALTSGGQAYDIDFLLRSNTRASDAVAVRARTAGTSPDSMKRLGRLFWTALHARPGTHANADRPRTSAWQDVENRFQGRAGVAKVGAGAWLSLPAPAAAAYACSTCASTLGAG